MGEIDLAAQNAKLSARALNAFIGQYKPFIIRTVSEHTRKYITDSDEEFSIGMSAFAEAIDKYSTDKGSFIAFARQVIQRRLTDYYRNKQRHSDEISVDPYVFQSEPEEGGEDLSLRLAVVEKVSFAQDTSLKDEIDAANGAFAKFGFTFFDLAECSPKAEKTKLACAKAVKFIMQNPVIYSEIYSSGTLPIKILEKNCDVPRKILERHRRYILAATEILSGEYPYLAEYMGYIRKEIGR